MSERINDLRDGVLRFAARMWRRPDMPGDWIVSDYSDLVNRAFADVTANVRGDGEYVRLSGQSGSGKTTQLLPAALAGFRAAGLNPAHVSVGFFARYHPFYNEIRARFGDMMLRESTNEFALILMFLTLEKMLRSGCPMVLEVALLDAVFEEFIALLLLSAGYRCEHHVLAVGKPVSDEFIKKRAECEGRVVTKKSADYFYDAQRRGLVFLGTVCPLVPCVLWNAFDANPTFVGRMSDAEMLAAFNRCRAMAPSAVADEAALLAAKTDWFINRRLESLSPAGISS
ncbi:MAG: zeta toxin family protein [Rickettsiales bacterium]|jgi:energy-coupling factor transporter ATP-binding protein EcfA2|nr:zeta toxin family protein [Rickettsiales bacterium]